MEMTPSCSKLINIFIYKNVKLNTSSSFCPVDWGCRIH